MILRDALRRVQRARWRGTGVILCYHGIHEDGLPFPIWTQMPAASLADHLDLLSTRYDCLTLHELVERSAADRLVGSPVAVTFDDGYANNHDLALPLLQRFGVPATIFATAGLIGTAEFTWFDRLATLLASTSRSEIDLDDGPLLVDTPAAKAAAYRRLTSRLKRLDADALRGWLDLHAPGILGEHDTYDDERLRPFFSHVSWSDLEDMAGSGIMTVGSHGMSHTILAVESLDRAAWEIGESKALLEARVGPVHDFAYPNGTESDYRPEHRQALADAGYRTVSTTRRERVARATDALDLPRLCVGHDCTAEQLDYYLTHRLR